MPLDYTGSKKSFGKNVAELSQTGRKRDQVLAIAYAVHRDAMRKKKKQKS